MKIATFPHTLGIIVDVLLVEPANEDLSFENSVERFLNERYLKITSPPLLRMLLVRRATKIGRKRHDNSN